MVDQLNLTLQAEDFGQTLSHWFSLVDISQPAQETEPHTNSASVTLQGSARITLYFVLLYM